MRRLIVLALLLFTAACGSVGNNDTGPETVDECPIQIEDSWLDGNPRGGYERDYLFLTVRVVGDSPILFKDGDMRVKITRPDGSSYTVTQNVCCELTRGSFYNPGEAVTILDIPEPEIDEAENVRDSRAEIVEQTSLDCKAK